MICSLVRFYLTLSQGDNARSFAQSHVKRCEACASHRAKLVRLDSELRSCRALAPRPRAKSMLPIRSRGGVPALAALTCAIAAIILIWKLPTDSSPVPTPSAPRVASIDHRSPQPAALHPGASTGWDIAPVELLRKSAPMQEELAALRQDGRRGLDAILSIGRRKKVAD